MDTRNVTSKDFFTLDEIDQVANRVRSQISLQPQVAVILGSGLGALADAVQEAQVISYQDLPFWPVSTVPGHQGRLVVGELEHKPVLVMQGRAHYYEGYSIAQVGLPVRVFQLNMIGMAGLNPLRGPNLDELGPRFPDMSRSYDRELCNLARKVAREQSLHLNEGVYVCLAGPSFETPADLRFLRMAGADAVGMSTVPEVTVARHGGMRVLGISGISNKANLDGSTITTHTEVLEAGRVIVPKLVTLIRGVLRNL
jgi:purine-nucleoside phosphorylase